MRDHPTSQTRPTDRLDCFLWPERGLVSSSYVHLGMIRAFCSLCQSTGGDQASPQTAGTLVSSAKVLQGFGRRYHLKRLGLQALAGRWERDRD